LITDIQTSGQQGTFNSLIHLGVAYNQLNDLALKKIQQTFPKLFCIDISNNRLESITGALQTLILLPDLKMLYLLGNPLTLAPNYRQVLKTKLQKLKILDGVPTLNEAENTKKKKPKADSALSSYSQRSQQGPDLVELVRDVQENFTMDLHMRVLQNIDGIYLTEETCKPEVLETLANDSDKSSIFWLSYQNHLGQQVKTEKKVWIQHFAVDKDTGIGKTDFQFKLRLNERPSFELSEWMRNDLFMELWETRPKLVEKRNEETMEMIKEVVLDTNNIPVIETRCRGVSSVIQ